jgi:hypothetical protein
MKGEMTYHERMRLPVPKDRKHFSENHLQPALAHNMIAMTTPDKPNSRNHKYRLYKVNE